MDAKAKTVREILQSGNQLLIPFFQRGYSWRKNRWEQLWSDLIDLMSDRKERKHFLGPLVCTLEKAAFGDIPVYLLIDGQQRVTTITLLLLALRDFAQDKGDVKLAEKVNEMYLVHKHEDGLQRYKVLPRIGDRDTLIAIIEGKIKKDHQQSELLAAYRYFTRCIEQFVSESGSPDAVSKLLGYIVSGLALVMITIDDNDQNSFAIFESLNSKGTPLEESDLVRNFVFMQVPAVEQEKFNKDCWSPFEELFKTLPKSDGEPSKVATTFFRHYLMRNGEYSKAKSTFSDFKASAQKCGWKACDLTTELTRFAEFDRRIRHPELEKESAISLAMKQIVRLDAATVTPLLLNLLDRHDRKELCTDELLGCIQDFASFVLRRSICGESTRAYGRWFVEAITCIGDAPRSELQQYWFKRGWPDDAAVTEKLLTFEIYHREPKKTRLILETIEESRGHKEPVKFDGLQIEHVMPQAIKSDADGKQWKLMLGDNWKDVHKSLLHTLGNLTLTAYNPELSNSSFETKQPELANSNLQLNKEIAAKESWDGETISKRTEALAEDLLKLWLRPEGGPEYVPSPESEVATKELLAEYWAAFEKEFASACPELSLDRPCVPSYKGLKGPRQCFWYMFYADPINQQISVGIELSGKYRQQWIALLWDNVSHEEQDGLESETGASCCWHDDWPQMYLLRDEVDVGNRHDWPAQHEWMCQTFARLDALLGERISRLNLSDYRPEALAAIANDFAEDSGECSDSATADSESASVAASYEEDDA